jgi:toxin YoeB
MRIAFEERGWKEYINWQTEDKRTLKKINELLKDTKRTPFFGLGKPEPLKGDLSGYWSREIDEKNRIVYKVENNVLIIAQCGSHYGDK